MIDPKSEKYWLNIRKENQLPHRKANFFQGEKFNSNNNLVRSKEYMQSRGDSPPFFDPFLSSPFLS
jgi:hypothetical protein